MLFLWLLHQTYTVASHFFFILTPALLFFRLRQHIFCVVLTHWVLYYLESQKKIWKKTWFSSFSNNKLVKTSSHFPAEDKKSIFKLFERIKLVFSEVCFKLFLYLIYTRKIFQTASYMCLYYRKRKHLKTNDLISLKNTIVNNTKNKITWEFAYL